MLAFIVSAVLSSAALGGIAYAEPAKFAPRVLTIEGKKYVAFPEAEAEELLDVVERQLPAALKLAETRQQVIEAQVKLLDIQKQLLEAYAARSQEERLVSDLWKSTAESLAQRVEDQEPGALEFIADTLQWIALGVAVYAVVRDGP